jgi:hypothetical protein
MSKKITVDITGMKKADAMTSLIQNGLSFTEAEAYWKANKSGTRADGFAGQFYAMLEQGVMTDEAFNQVIAAGSENVQRHKSHYNGIRLMANKIWSAK